MNWKYIYLKYLPYVCVLLLGYIITYAFYAPMMMQPASYLSSVEGDGIKNYFTFAYHLRWGSGWDFAGMNYPFGDLILFTDNHPILALLGSSLRNVFPYLGHSPAAIINIIMLYSMPFCAVFLYSLLRRFELPTVVAIVGALLIAYLSPQLARINGHMALSYTFFVPMLWWLILRFTDAVTKLKKLVWSVSVTLFLIFWAYIHLYYLLIGVLFVLSYVFVRAVGSFIHTQNERTVVLKKMTLLALAVVVALGCTFYSISYLDTIVDRVKSPWGFYYYYANFNSVFYPETGFWRDCLLRLPVPYIEAFNPDNMEGKVYVGFWGIWVLGGTIFAILYSVFRKKALLNLPPLLLHSLIAAILLLWFSFCLPFKWFPETLVEKIPYLVQFRSLGRFAWCFYYVFGVYMVYFLYHILKLIPFLARKKNVLHLIYTVIALIWAAEIRGYLGVNTAHTFNKTTVFNGNEPQKFTKILAANKRDVSDFQAILSLPFYHIGSEKLWEGASPRSLQHSFGCSFETGLPIVDVALSRTSLQQMLSTYQIVSDSLIPKSFFKQLPNKKPFLVIQSLDKPLKPTEMYLIQHFMKKIASVEHEYILYELDVNTDFERPIRNIKQAFERLNTTKNTPILYNTAEPVFIQTFDKYTYTDAFRGNGALAWANNYNHKIWSNRLILQADSVKMSISMWVRMDVERCCLPKMEVITQQRNGKDTLVQNDYHTATTVSKNWAYHSMEVWVYKKHPKLDIAMSGYFDAIDELWIRPSDATVFDNRYNKSEKVVFNNFDIPF
jgi:hypothetical protein